MNKDLFSWLGQCAPPPPPTQINCRSSILQKFRNNNRPTVSFLCQLRNSILCLFCRQIVQSAGAVAVTNKKWVAFAIVTVAPTSILYDIFVKLQVVQCTCTHKQYTEQQKTNKIWNNTKILEECRPCPRFCGLYPGVCLTTEEKVQ
jgi:hypothetical protein